LGGFEQVAVGLGHAAGEGGNFHEGGRRSCLVQALAEPKPDVGRVRLASVCGIFLPSG
jgi:hypothetical protein